MSQFKWREWIYPFSASFVLFGPQQIRSCLLTLNISFYIQSIGLNANFSRNILTDTPENALVDICASPLSLSVSCVCLWTSTTYLFFSPPFLCLSVYLPIYLWIHKFPPYSFLQDWYWWYNVHFIFKVWISKKNKIQK
jgi:hypothetical protein